MPDQWPRFDLQVTNAARRDIVAILKRSEKEFGKEVALRYEALLEQALRDIAADPERPGSRERPELATKRSILSRDRARTDFGVVRHPRHFVIYRCREGKGVIEVIRVIHESRELQRNLGEEQRAYGGDEG